MLVIGAGVAGCAAAITARQLHPDLRVRLVAGTDHRPAVGESIPPDAQPLLDQLGVAAEFTAAGHEPCLGSASAWGSSRLGYNDFVTNPYGTGWHLDRPRFEAMLRRRADAVGVCSVTGTVRELRRAADGFAVTLADGATMTARFVVDATGARAAAGRRLGARHRWYDRLVVASAFLATDPARRQPRITLLEAAPDGWWYLAGLPDDRLIVSYASDPDTARDTGSARWPEWTQQLVETTHVAARLAGCTLLSERLTSLSAASRLLDPVAGPGWLAVGDAAASHDPLSARGIYQALHTGTLAATELCAGEASPERVCTGYAETVLAEFEEYLANQRYLYAAEQRYADRPFWARRHAAALAA
ncbi:MAG TPA: tryptophan 7-halogenase [Jatrophihabitans sp.]|nr:tryptophan 7-halogenase [Jatrophihabitans sp.]